MTIQEIKWKLFSTEANWRGSSVQNSAVCAADKKKKTNALVSALWKLQLLLLLRTCPATRPQSGSFSQGLMFDLGDSWPQGTRTAGAGCHISFICRMQEQYKLVYNAVIELFKRQIEALDAQEDSASSQVKVTRTNAQPLAAWGTPGLILIPTAEWNKSHFALYIHNYIVTEASNLLRCLCCP